MLDVSSPQQSTSDAMPAPLQALYALAELRTSAPTPAQFLERASAIAARGSGCAFGAVILIASATEATVHTDRNSEGAYEALLSAEPGAPARRAIDELRVLVSPEAGRPGWAAVPVLVNGVATAALIVADAQRAGTDLNLAFLQAMAAFIAPSVVATSPPARAAEPAGAVRADIAALLESIVDPVALIRTDGTLGAANNAYRRLLADAGLPDGPISAHSNTVMRRDRAGRPINESERALPRALTGRGTRSERVLRMADGRDRVFLLNTSPVKSDDDTVEGIAAVWHEITEQIAPESALRLMEEVRRGLSLSGDLRGAARSVCRRAVSLLSWVDMAAVYALDGDEPVLQAQAGFPVRASRLLAKLAIGPTHRATIAMHENEATIFRTDQDAPANEASRRFVAASGAATFVNLPLRAGPHRFGLLVLAGREPHPPSRDELGVLAAMAGQVGAELEGVRRREEAEAERARLQAVLDQLPEGVLLFDAGGRLVMSNHSSVEIVGQVIDPTTPVLALGSRYGFMHADGRPYHHGDDPLALAFSTGQPALGEEQLVRRSDGRDLPVVSNVAPVRDAKGQLAAVIMVFQDITSLREMDRLKDDFLSIAGHELRTPITTIRGLSQLVERRRHRLDEATVNAALTTINEQTDQMARLVDELLDVSHIRTGRLSLEFARFDFAGLLNSIVQRAALVRHELIRLEAPASLELIGDAGRLEQVFSNLIDNAVKYSDARTSIEVSVLVGKNEVTVSVLDHGLGVPQEALSRVFERFYRADNATDHAGGLGLGLYLCREIVERHGGRIDLTSVLGQGSTFTVRLPKSPRKAAND